MGKHPSLTVGTALRTVTKYLEETSDTARLDAEVMMAHRLGISRSEMLLRHLDDPCPRGVVEDSGRRAAHEPVAYIVGEQEFYGLSFKVGPGVLIPRSDSEVLIEAARQHFGDAAPARVIDLGTGSGALLLAALSIFPQAAGIGIDASEAALEVANANAQSLGLASRAQMFERDWNRAGWTDGLGRFDLVLCNPPYVEATAALDRSVRDYEPASALFSGSEGLDDYRLLIPQLGKLKNADGAIILEIGANQAEAVSRLACESGFAVTLHHDLAGRPRALTLT